METKVMPIYDAIFNNGTFEVGISAGADPALPEADRLAYFTTGNSGERATTAAAKFLLGKNIAEPLVIFEAAGAFYTAALGWVGVRESKVVDGDAYGVDKAIPLANEALEAIKKLDANQVITTIIATKANWYAMNHHVGQGALSGYVRKVHDVWFSNVNDDAFKAAAWRMGHRASTWAVLQAVGVTVPNAELACSHAVIPNVAADVSIRFRSAPAGTHKANVFVAGAMRLARSPLRICVPERKNFFMVAASVGRLDNPSKHIGWNYLGYASKTHNDDEYRNYLGRIGSFILNIYPKSDLAKSPLLIRYQAYTDYDDAFEGICKSYRQASARNVENASKLISEVIAPDLSTDELKAISDLTASSSARIELVAPEPVHVPIL